MASDPSIAPDKRNTILDFFTTFYHTYEYHRVDLSKSPERFLPAQDSKLFRPAEVYSNPACAILGFPVLAQRFLSDASKFGVLTDPSSPSIEGILIRHPPTSIPDARAKFAYIATRLTCFTQSQLVTLSKSNIIPVRRGNMTRLVAPVACFLDRGEKERVWEDIFDFVTFGTQGDLFLEGMGVKARPDEVQIADQIARDPKRIYQAMDVTGYLRLLGTLGGSIAKLQRERGLWSRLRDSPFLVGVATFKEGEEEKTMMKLVSAKNVVIVDEPRLAVIFKNDLTVAPERDDAETLYSALGSAKLSSLVKQKHRVRGPATSSSATEGLKKHIIERTGIFLSLPELAPQILRSSSYLSSQLNLLSHSDITVERTLTFRPYTTHAESVTAVLSSPSTLLVTSPDRVNYSQVAEALNALLLKKTNRGTDLMFETILKESLEFLRWRGFAVDRLLNQRVEEERLATARKEEEERKKREDEKMAKECEMALVAGEKKMEEKRLSRGKPRARASLERKPLLAESTTDETKLANGITENGATENGHLTKSQAPLPGSWQRDPPPATFPPPRPAFLSSIKSALGLPAVSSPPHPSGPSLPTSKSSITSQLTSAIAASRPYNSSTVFHPPTSSTVTDAPQSYCDATEAKDLQLHGQVAGVPAFFARGQRERFLATMGNREGDVGRFVGLLGELGGVYNVRGNTFHLFFDEGGRTIAFNSSGSLFFNISFTPFPVQLMTGIFWSYMPSREGTRKTHRYGRGARELM
jgi:Protein of unknown function (DUF3684)